jgi:predicted MFS family arabinose efflux permease
MRIGPFAGQAAGHAMRGMIRLVAGLGVAQVISWGSLYYAIGVLGPSMRAELGVTELFLFGSFTAGLLVCGALAPWIGRLIDRKGGRVVLSAGSIAASAAMIILATSTSRFALVAGWMMAGAAMTATLYDPAFATLSQHAGDRYRRCVTALTLLGGFASTAFWPLSHVLLDAWGWRAAFAIYAAMHLLVCLPIHAWMIPRSSGKQSHGISTDAPARSPAFGTPGLMWLNGAFAIANFVVGVVAVYMVVLLQGAGLDAAQAVTIAMLMGPMQVAGRLLEIGFLAKKRATRVGGVAFASIIGALVVLAGASGMWLAVIFVAMYGFGNGLLTIVRGAVPAEIYGSRGLGELLGHLSRTSSYARALAPAGYAGMLAIGLTQPLAMLGLAVALSGGLACYSVAIRSVAARDRPSTS